MKLIGNWQDSLCAAIALVAAMEYGVGFGLFLLLVAIFMRLGHLIDRLERMESGK